METLLLKHNQTLEKSFLKKADEYTHVLRKVSESADYSASESSINAPFDLANKEIIDDLVAEFSSSLKYIFVIGIGGSNLGTLAIYQALRGGFDYLLPETSPKMIFLDTLDPVAIASVHQIISAFVTKASEVAVCIITKSGTTTETVVNFEVLYSFLYDSFGDDILHQIVAITDNGSALQKSAKKKGFHILEIPKNVGGRYSVFTSVGIFPLKLAGVNTTELLKGASSMRNLCLSESFDENIALSSACLTMSALEKSQKIANHFFFHPSLEGVGKWWRQLVAESLGKQVDISGSTVHAGFTPVVSIGTTDLHSQAQLYLAGPDDKFTQFISCAHQAEVQVPEPIVLDDMSNNFVNKKITDIVSAILSGTKKAYDEHDRKYSEIILPKISEFFLGEYLQFCMMETMYIGYLMGVNAFDQPNVESYKKYARESM